MLQCYHPSSNSIFLGYLWKVTWLAQEIVPEKPPTGYLVEVEVILYLIAKLITALTGHVFWWAIRCLYYLTPVIKYKFTAGLDRNKVSTWKLLHASKELSELSNMARQIIEGTDNYWIWGLGSLWVTECQCDCDARFRQGSQLRSRRVKDDFDLMLSLTIRQAGYGGHDNTQGRSSVNVFNASLFQVHSAILQIHL